MSHLPTFLLIGAAKSGTTSLSQYLGRHPDIFVCPLKEPNFFAFEGQNVCFQGPGDEKCNQLSVTSLPEYKRLFRETDASVRGEASPSSLYYPQAPKRIAKYVPSVKLLVILRNPVERAYSNFLMMIKQGREPHRNFSTALEAEEERLNAGWSYFWGYKQLGFYYRQLSRYYDHFAEDQICVCLFRDLVQNPSALLTNLFCFLGVDPSFQPKIFEQHNPSGVPQFESLHWLLYHAGLRPALKSVLPHSVNRFLSNHFSIVIQSLQDWKIQLLRSNLNHPPMSPNVRRRLQTLFRDDILRLENLIERDLSHWLEERDSV